MSRREAWLEGQLDLDPERLVFIDETWAKTNMARRHGRCLQGERLGRRVAEVARENLYVTASGMFSAGCLQRCVEILGVDRLLFSTDYPYQYRPGRDARGFLEHTLLDEAGRAKFAHRNWELLTGPS